MELNQKGDRYRCNCLKVGDLIIRKAYLHTCIIVSLFILKYVNISYCITRSITAVYCFFSVFRPLEEHCNCDKVL